MIVEFLTVGHLEYFRSFGLFNYTMLLVINRQFFRQEFSSS